MPRPCSAQPDPLSPDRLSSGHPRSAAPSAAGETFRVHGGRLEAARRAHPGAPEPWIDLSTGINPIPYPLGTLPVEAFARLPDPADLAGLAETARAAYGAPSDLKVVPVAGSDLAIGLLPRLVAPGRRVAILAPAYGGHARAWAAAGHEVTEIAWDEGAAGRLGAADVAVVVNPNNPDGRLIPVPVLAQAAATAAARGALLVIDEAFADAVPGTSVLGSGIDLAATVVLRSFGKFYGLAGLRLGFALGGHPVLDALAAAVGDWPVSGPALLAGRRALADPAWQAAARERLMAAARRLDAVLTGAGLEVTGGTPLFRYARHPHAGAIFATLCRQGILTRPFAEAPDRLRFGLPADDQAFFRLRTALERGA